MGTDLKFLVAVLLACGVGLGFGYLEGHQADRYRHSSREYAEAAKRNAIVGCANPDPAVVADCVYDEIESSRESSQADQDLQAQQWMARWAALLTFITIATTWISWIALRYLRDTFRETSRGAQAAADATDAMIDANRIARASYSLDSRPWVCCGKIFHETITRSTLGIKGEAVRIDESIALRVPFQNYGKVPAQRVGIRQTYHIEGSGLRLFDWPLDPWEDGDFTLLLPPGLTLNSGRLPLAEKWLKDFHARRIALIVEIEVLYAGIIGPEQFRTYSRYEVVSDGFEILDGRESPRISARALATEIS